MKTFSCHISDPEIIKTIRAPEKELKYLRDVRSKIAKALNLQTSQFTITNQPEDKKLHSVLNNYKFEVTINERCKDIDFVLPNKKEVNIPNCYRLTMPQVLQQIEQNCSVYYSRECILKKNLHFMINQKNVLPEAYPFFALPPETKVEVKLFGKTITLEYAGKQIVLTDNDTLAAAKDTIIRAFKDETAYHLITIRNEPSDVELKGRDKLKSSEKYQIFLKSQFTFCQLNKPSNQIRIHLDYSAKISDAQEYMSHIFNDGEFKPENIILYDKEKQEIEDREKVLREIQAVKEQYYFKVVKEEQPPKVEEDDIHVSEEHKAEEAAMDAEEERELAEHKKEGEDNGVNLFAQVAEAVDNLADDNKAEEQPNPEDNQPKADEEEKPVEPDTPPAAEPEAEQAPAAEEPAADPDAQKAEEAPAEDAPPATETPAE